VLDTATQTVKEATRGVHQECMYVASGALTTDGPTTLYAGPCIMYGIAVTAALSAHVCAIKDGTTQVVVVPASAANGALYAFPWGVRFETSLVVDPDDATTTGSLTLFYRPL
jgi:hypothetical protein